MKCELWYSVVVRDPNGKVISRERRKSRSFVKQWNQLIYMHMAGVSLDMVDTEGTTLSRSRHTLDFGMNAAAGLVTKGIVVGTGDTAVTINDYQLAAIIAEGAGVGQINYASCTVATSVVSAPTCGFLVARSAVNNHADTITVKESGIYMGQATYSMMAVRDVFVTPQDVPNGGSITINYTLRVSA